MVTLILALLACPCGDDCQCTAAKNCGCLNVVHEVVKYEDDSAPQATQVVAVQDLGPNRRQVWTGTQWQVQEYRRVCMGSRGCANFWVAVQPAPQTKASQAGYHSHKCGACGHVFSHRDGSGASHMCPSCGRGPWYSKYGYSSSSSSRRAVLPWRR